MKNKLSENFLQEAFKAIEAVREQTKKRPPIEQLVVKRGNHIYSNGLFETLSPNFISSGGDVKYSKIVKAKNKMRKAKKYLYSNKIGISRDGTSGTLIEVDANHLEKALEIAYLEGLMTCMGEGWNTMNAFDECLKRYKELTG